MEFSFLRLFFILLIFFISLSQGKDNPNGMTTDRVEILSVSTQIDLIDYKPYGSLNGGTIVFLKAYGHNRTPSKNKINIGPYDCIIEEAGISGDMIACKTTKAFDPQQRNNLIVELHVTDKIQSKCKAVNHCYFTYTQNYTPMLRNIEPNTSTPDSYINWNAIWRVNESEKITKLQIGDYNCNRFQLADVKEDATSNLNDNIDINANNYVNLPCQMSPNIPAGFYNVRADIVWGEFWRLPTSKMLTADGSKEYDFVVTADITSISQNEGGESGNRIIINGKGFSDDETNVQVQVGDINCSVVSIKNEEIICDLEQGITETAEPGKFISGQGLLLDVWQFDDSQDLQYFNPGNLINFKQHFDNNTIPEERKIKSNIVRGNWNYQLDSNYQRQGVWARGYFKAPRTGNYKFWAGGNEYVKVYLNTNNLDQSINENNLILDRTSYTSYTVYNNPNQNNFKQEEGQIMNKDEYYWIELFMYNPSGYGYFTLSVETPPIINNEYAINSLDQIKEFKITPKFVPEEFTIKMWGTEDDLFSFQFIHYESRKKVWDRTTIQRKWSDWANNYFAYYINWASGYHETEIIEQISLDLNGNTCTGECTPSGVQFKIRFNLYRNYNPIPKCNQGTDKCTVTKTQSQSDPVSGTYKMNFGNEPIKVWVSGKGWTEDIPHSYHSSHILSGLKLLNEDFINTTPYYSGRYYDGYRIGFQFRTSNLDYKGNVPEFSFDTSNLRGGSDDQPTIQQAPYEVVSASYNSFYEPVPFDMSYTPADKPQVSVTVNGIQSVCSNDCSYQTLNTKTPIIDSFTEASNQLSLDLSSNTINLTNQNIKIWYGGSKCTNIDTTTLSNVTCQVSKIEAGDNIPKMLVEGYGFASYNGSSQSHDLIIDSISPNSGSTLGGLEITITGQGLPIYDHSNLIVKFGESIATVISTSNTQIVVQLPEAPVGEQSENVVVIFNEKTSNQDKQFTYSNIGLPTITQINPISASPVKKQNITIQGSNFGTDYQKIKVYLENTETKIKLQLAVQQENFTDTQFIARLGGGHVGNYKLNIILEGKGYSIANPISAVDFQYVINLDSVTPQTGNPNGGSFITLNGSNFLNTLTDNSVYLQQNEIYLKCYIVSATSTEIVVRIPSQSTESNDPNYNFVVYGRQIEKSICNGDCSFQYQDNSGSLPIMDSIQPKNYYNGEKVIITGSNFVVSDGVEIEVNQQKFPATVDSQTQITFNIPLNLQIGVYNFLLYNGPSGFIGGFKGTIILSITSIQPSDGISKFGSDIKINGSGFNEDTRVLVKNVICPITSYTSTQINCIAPPLLQEGTFKVTLTQPSYDSISYNGVKYLNSKTPTISKTDQIGTHTSIYDLSDRIVNYLPVKYYTKTLVAGSNFTINILESTNITGNNIKVYLQSTVDPKVRIEADTLSQLSAQFTNPQAGSYFLKVQVEGYGFALPDINSDQAVWEYIFTLPQPTISAGSLTSLVGTTTLTLSGTGFDTINHQNNEVYVCGEICDIIDVTQNQLECKLPQINTKYISDLIVPKNQVLNPLFTEGINQIKKVTTSQDSQNDVSNTWDYANEYHIINLSSQVVGTVEEKECWVKFESYDDSLIEFQSVQWHIEDDHASSRGNIEKTELYYEFTVQGSNNNIDWVDLANNKPYDLVNFKKNQHQHANYGYGGFNRDAPPTPYKYIRAKETTTQDRQNTCHYHSIHLYGKLTYATDVTTTQDLTCSVVAKVQGQSSDLSNTVTYSAAETATVVSISPIYASILGGDEITIQGSGFGTEKNDVSVTIDDIPCVINTLTNDTLQCTTGSNSSSTNYSSIVKVLIAEVPAIITKTVKFNMGLLYSDENNTWNGELAPREGDSIYLPKGQTLIVDQSTEKLDNVIIEGTLVFADNQAIEFFAHNIIIRSGKFIIGSIDSPYQNDLTITLHGNYWDKQLPEFGNKVLGCHTCELQIHGKPKIPTWTSLKTTVQPDQNEIQIKTGNTNWQVGDQIVIATTDYYGDHSENAYIISITNSPDGDTIVLDRNLEYKHISTTEVYGDKNLVMEAEVGNLTRNVVFQGSEQDSIQEQYGAHLKAHGSSLDGTLLKISQAEFRYTGQPKILGRYNIHFHMIGNAVNSLIDGIAVHNSFARVVAVHAVHNLRIQNSVGYNSRGHNIFLEDGSETGNVVENNLIISPLSAFNMLQTDITVAAIWITHPSNYVRNNHMAGSQFYGLWYEIKERVGTTAHACPMGSEILEVKNNVAHSNTRFGLRFFNLQPRKYPCQPIRNNLIDDPFSQNPSIQSLYSGGTYYKNGESGILAEFLGNSIFEDFILADNFRTGFQTHTTNFTSEQVIFKDSIVVGQTQNNGEQLDYDQTAIILPRTDGFLAQNIKVYNMVEGTYILESNSENQNLLTRTQGGYSSTVENIQLTNCENAGIIKWRGPLRNYVYDKDGSLSTPSTNAPTYYTPYYPHFDQVINDGGCLKKTVSQKFSNYDSVQCTTILRGIKFGSMVDHDLFVGQKMKVLNLNDEIKAPLFGTEEELQENYGESESVLILSKPKDGKDQYAMVYATGYVYNVHWNQGLDWSHAMLYPSYVSEPTDPKIILRFNYTQQRELYDIYKMVGGQLIETINPKTDFSDFIDPITSKPTTKSTGCKLGDYYHDTDNKFMYMCIDGNLDRKSEFQQIDMNGVYCRDTCPTDGFDCPTTDIKKRSFMYSDNQQNQIYYTENEGTGQPLIKSPGTDVWVYGIPKEGDDVRIPCDYVVEFNLASWTFGTLVIDGTLRITQEHDNIHIRATNIWVRSGRLLAGDENQNNRFTKNLTIELVGNKNSLPLQIDDISSTGTKSLAVTGEVKLYGIYPSVSFTRLKSTANINDSKIKVIDEEHVKDWKIGDELVLGANSLTGLGYEKLKIKNIIDNEIEFTTPIQNWHYGNDIITIGTENNSELQIDQKYGGQLDMRCPIGNVSRNIKIIGSDEDGLGGHFQIYHYIKDDDTINLHIDSRGSAILEGVEFANMGQHESNNAGLHILQTNIKKEQMKQTLVEHSSFHDCFGFCVNFQEANEIVFNENVVYNGERFLIQALEVQKIYITNNLLIGAKLRQGGVSAEAETGMWDPVALLHMYTPYLPSIDTQIVKNNVGSGSQGIGYAFPATPCIESSDIGYQNNEVGYCLKTGILFNLKENMCYHVGYASVYHSHDGITLNNKNSDDGWEATNIICAENQTNLILHSSSYNIVHNNSVFKTFITTLARKNCQDCYNQESVGTNTYCKNSNGIQLHVTTNGGESFPWTKDPFIYDVICTAPSVFGSSLLTDLELHGFRNIYDEQNYPYASQCGQNTGFRNHGSAASASAGTYLKNVKCTECDKDSIIYIMEPRESWRGWFGGCGQFDCTGLENMIIQDMTGDLLGYIGTIISNNEAIGYSEQLKDKCQLVKKWNAFECETDDFGVLEWESEGDDKQKISPVPVYVSNDSWEKNKLNMWREWSWQGPEPLNERHNRFLSLVYNNQAHNITYSGSQSVDIVHKLQSRNNDPQGEIDRHIIIQTNYNSPLTLQLSIKSDNDRVVKSFPFHKPENLENHAQTCGANNYFFQNNTIHFVITNERDCQINIRQLNNVQINMRLSMTKEEFFSDDAKQTSFINRMASFLNISFDRIKIVGLQENSRRNLLADSKKTGITLQFVVTANVPGSKDNGYGPQNDFVQLKDYTEKIQQSINDNTLSKALEMEVQSAEYEYVVLQEVAQDEDKQEYFTQADLDKLNQQGVKRENEIEDKKAKEERDQIIAISISIIFGVIALIIMAMVMYHLWKKKQIRKIHAVKQQEIPQDDISFKPEVKQDVFTQGSQHDFELKSNNNN